MFIDKYMFKYRIRTGSLITKAGKDGHKKVIEYMYKKHWDLAYEVYHKLYARGIMYKNDMKKPLRSFIKYTKKKFLN